MNRALGSSTLRELAELGSDRDRLHAVNAWGRQCGWCREPIRLRSRTTTLNKSTGEILESDGGEYLKACGSRRATRCPGCAERYRGDAREIVGSGLRGGKGIPESVSSHPAVFVTLTAPSFGAVHRVSGRGERRCREGRERRCVHGALMTCHERHDSRDGRVGSPLCPRCYEYERAVVWNALASELWRRTTIYIRRELARELGLGEAEFRRRVQLSFAKVVEYQRRGAIHIHAVIRIDAPGKEVRAGEVGMDTLVEAIRTAVASVFVRYPGQLGGVARFGRELQIDRLEPGDSQNRRRMSGYVAKYATKSSDANGGLDRRLQSLLDLSRRELPPHLRRLAETAWRLDGSPELRALGMRRFAHTLGFRGHWLTKSRRWSTTFTALRTERERWREHQKGGVALVAEGDTVEVCRRWRYCGVGWETAGEAMYVESRRKREELGRLIEREAFGSPGREGP